MGLSSFQVCMNTSDYLQSVNHEGDRTDSSESPSGDVQTCSRPLEKRPRPDNDQVIKCPRCESTHTKFCYYNNYSLTQPRYFCKACRRYWTKGGSLRNVPVGGGCRKNKKMPTKKSNEKALFQYNSSISPHGPMPTNLHGSFSEVKLSDLTKLFGNTGNLEYNSAMDSQFDAILGNDGGRDFMGINEFGLIDDVTARQGFTHNFQNFCSPFEISTNENNGALAETNRRLAIPCQSEDTNGSEMKPTTFLSLDWQGHGRPEERKESSGFLEEFAAWNSLMNSYGSSTTDLLA